MSASIYGVCADSEYHKLSTHHSLSRKPDNQKGVSRVAYGDTLSLLVYVGVRLRPHIYNAYQPKLSVAGYNNIGPSMCHVVRHRQQPKLNGHRLGRVHVSLGNTSCGLTTNCQDLCPTKMVSV